jgi:hypothetical protein
MNGRLDKWKWGASTIEEKTWKNEDGNWECVDDDWTLMNCPTNSHRGF